ncbi:MAG TPA: hypothetical protein VE871_08880 [Longimicrobium sp.]|nr:hypothetical protein [Longimicrobium sp.]
MKKLRLSMDALQVETFETLTVVWREVGTVQARGAVANAMHADEGTEASNCATCDTCQGPNCCGCANSTEA